MTTTSISTKPFYERSRLELVRRLGQFNLPAPRNLYEHLAIAKILDRLADMTEIALKKDGRLANSALPSDLHRLAGVHFGKAGFLEVAKKKERESSLLMQEAILHHVTAEANSITNGADTFAAQKKIASILPMQEALLNRMKTETQSLTELRVASGSTSSLIAMNETPAEKALVEMELSRLFPKMFIPLIPVGLLRLHPASPSFARLVRTI